MILSGSREICGYVWRSITKDAGDAEKELK